MVRCLPALILAVVAMPASAAAGNAAAVHIAAPPARAGWFVCDGIDGSVSALFGARDAAETSIVTLVDRDAGRTTTSRVTAGTGDPGAGQIFYALSRGGKPAGNVHMVNPGLVGDPVLPAVTSVELDGHRIACRFMADMQFLGIAPGRSVMVRGQGVDLVYESFDDKRRGKVTRPDGVHRSTVPSLAIPHGQASATGFRFSDRGVDYALDPRHVIARQGGRTIATDAFLGSEAVVSRATHQRSGLGRPPPP